MKHSLSYFLSPLSLSLVSVFPAACFLFFSWLVLVFFVFFFAFPRKTADGASVLGGFGFQGYGADGKVAGWDGVRK